MKYFLKTINDKKEVELQKLAANIGVSPIIYNTDMETYIEMEDLEEMNIADKYGDQVYDVPKYIMDQVYIILLRLYRECNIQYVDVTPYNFIEKEGKVWIIDFSRAFIGATQDIYLKKIFKNQTILDWNPLYK